MTDFVASFTSRSGAPRGRILLPDHPTIIRFAVEYGLCPHVPGILVRGDGATVLRILDNRLLEPHLAIGPIMLATTIYRPVSIPADAGADAERHCRELIARIRDLSAGENGASPADYDHQLNYLHRRLLALSVAYDFDPSAPGYLAADDLAAAAPAGMTAPIGPSWTHHSPTF